MTILAIETSCDETSAAIIKDMKVLSNIVSSQLFHKEYGGVVPELASRGHIRNITLIVNQALSESKNTISDIEAISVTSKPGLIGSLIVGTNFGKGLALKYNIPIVPINHLEGHIYSGCMDNTNVKFPIISLVVSGGHTALFKVKSYTDYELIGATRDDAAGEAFDKIATMMGLPYPGGPEIDKLATKGDSSKYKFPRGMISDDNFDFSFSGLKTSVRYFIKNHFPNGAREEVIPDIAASVQTAIVDVLVYKTINAAKKYNAKNITVAGGVSANSELRRKMSFNAEKENIRTILPDLSYCTDNAAMIGFIAEQRIKTTDFLKKSDVSNLTFTAAATVLKKFRR